MANACSVSTTWAYKQVIVRRSRRRPEESPPQASSLRRLTVWPRRNRLSLTVTYNGGNEAWYEIKARGVTFRRPGWLALDDIMSEIYNDV